MQGDIVTAAKWLGGSIVCACVVCVVGFHPAVTGRTIDTRNPTGPGAPADAQAPERLPAGLTLAPAGPTPEVVPAGAVVAAPAADAPPVSDWCAAPPAPMPAVAPEAPDAPPRPEYPATDAPAPARDVSAAPAGPLDDARAYAFTVGRRANSDAAKRSAFVPVVSIWPPNLFIGSHMGWGVGS